jgi:hypothetical protein
MFAFGKRSPTPATLTLGIIPIKDFGIFLGKYFKPLLLTLR